MGSINLGRVRGPGVPEGGTMGQVLVKKTSTNYDTKWVDSEEIAGNNSGSGSGGLGSVAAYAGIGPFLVASGKKQLTLNNEGETIIIDVAPSLDAGSLTGGKDYYVFLHKDNGTTHVSLSKINPQGISASNVLLIGGFHTLCNDAGSGMTYVEGGVTKSHPLNGYLAGDILPASVWCLNHRPFSEPEGMVYIDSLDIWVDIYLQSGSGANTKSVYQGAITRSRQYVDHVEDMFCVKKELLDDGEFAAAMLGSNEMTAVAGADEAGATSGGAGGRVDTAGRRMISIYGVEEGCGTLWHWLRTTSAAGYQGILHGQTSAEGVEPVTYGAITMTDGTNYGPHPQAGGKGAYWGIAGALLAGGAWYSSASCGSRCRAAAHGRAFANSSYGGRGRSRTIRAFG